MASFSIMTDVPNPVFDSNGDPFSGAVLKAFLPGGTTSTSIAIDEDGGSPQASITYNAQGKLEVSGNEILPFIDRKHKWGIFANAADATANTPFYQGPYDDVPKPTDENDLNNRVDRTNPDTLAIAIADATLLVGDVLHVKDRGNVFWEVVTKGTTPLVDLPDTFGVVASTGNTNLAIALRVDGWLDAASYGFIPSGNNTAALRQALLDYGYVLVQQSGVYETDSTIDLRFKKSLYLSNNVTIRRTTALSATADPVFFVRGSFSAIVGEGRDKTAIETENKCPDGVVKLGFEDMVTVPTGNVEKCRLNGFTMRGPTAFGQTSGAIDVGLHIPSPELATFFNYYHSLNDLSVENVNVGYWFRGWANGIRAAWLYGVNIGNTSLAPAAMIHYNGPLDGMITDTFLNVSPDTTGLLVDKLDNTANGSPQVMVPQSNSFKGIITEQGGAAALTLDVKDSLRSYFEIRDNSSLGFSVHNDFFTDNNILLAGQSAGFPSTKVTELFCRGNAFFGVNKNSVDISQTGIQLVDLGSSGFTSEQQNALLLNRKITSGDILQLRKDGTVAGSLGEAAADLYIQNVGSGLRFSGNSNEIFPCDATGGVRDNLIAWGATFSRFTEFFATNNVINTSDEREKEFQGDFSAKEKAVALKLKSLLAKFKWNDSIEREEKGGKKARIHIGIGAQSLGKAFVEEGLNPGDYAMFCYDEWDEEITDGIVTVEAGNRYSVRLEQVNSFIIAHM